MIEKEQAAAWLANHPEETGDGAYMAQAIVDLHDEVADLTTRLRLAEASVSLLRADLEQECKDVCATLRRLTTDAQDLTMATILARDAARAELDTFAAFHRTKTDALALELRRLRAAEAPGTDDAAFEGTGWVAQSPNGWRHFADGRHSIPVWRDEERWLRWDDASTVDYRFALDAMRAAVPGSV